MISVQEKRWIRNIISVEKRKTEQQSGRRGRPIPTEQRIGWTGKAPSRTYYFHKKTNKQRKTMIEKYHEVIHNLPKNKGTQPDLLLSHKTKQTNKQKHRDIKTKQKNLLRRPITFTKNQANKNIIGKQSNLGD